jgi:ribosome biogenesis GTPase
LSAPTLAQIGFDPFFEAQLGALEGGRVPARIAIAHGESYVSWTADGVRKAVLAGRRMAAWRTPADRPQVGDWVAGTYSGSAGALVVEHLLARRTCLVRRAAGARAEAQVIASNVDVVGVVSAFGGGEVEARDRRLINEERIRRYLMAVEQSRATPVLIVNKSDLSAEPETVAATLARAFPGVPVVSTSGQSSLGVEQLRRFVRAGQTLALVGMSGVGKSTLVNALLGRSAQEIGDVRAGDARGRHTTTHRELFMTETGALLIDTPGMREMGLWEIEEVVPFDDVVALAATCRFTNCRHQSEPGCAIRAALEGGALAPERWHQYNQQQQLTANSARGVSSAHARGRRKRQ